MNYKRGFKYILNEKGEPTTEFNTLKWAKWLDSANRTVAKEQIGEATVSTVFLGLDHSFGEGNPLLWETMVFGGLLDEQGERCSGSQEQAEAMHVRMVEKVKTSQDALDAKQVEPVNIAANVATRGM